MERRQAHSGQEWAPEIIRQLDEADIILLLITSSFFGSEFIGRVELARALERHHRDEAIVIPVVLKPADSSGFGELTRTKRGWTRNPRATDDRHAIPGAWRSFQLGNGAWARAAAALPASARSGLPQMPAHKGLASRGAPDHRDLGRAGD